jgi:NADPH2:quinone reductase
MCTHLSDDLSGVSLQRLPRAVLGPEDVRLRVLRVGLNFPDLMMTAGTYHLKPDLPFVPGMEGVAEVLEAGSKVTSVRPGDRMCFHAKHGALSEERVLPAASLRPLPGALDLDAAACHFVTGLTAWVALVRIGQLQRDQALLVHGARGGVGTACIQLGLHLGARILATASDPGVLARWRKRGVKALRADADLAAAVNDATQGRGADVVVDPVGGDMFDASMRCTAFGGRILVLGFASGRMPTLRVQHALNRGVSIHGVRAGEYGRRFPGHGVEHVAAVERLAAEGVLCPTVGARFPLAEAREALQALKERRVVGKIVVDLESPTRPSTQQTSSTFVVR